MRDKEKICGAKEECKEKEKREKIKQSQIAKTLFDKQRVDGLGEDGRKRVGGK